MSQNHHSQNRVREHFADEAVEVAERSYEAVQDTIRKEPMASTLAAFGIGIAIGTAAAVLLSRKSRPAMSVSSFESFGRKVLDSLGDVLPESVRQHIPR